MSTRLLTGEPVAAVAAALTLRRSRASDVIEHRPENRRPNRSLAPLVTGRLAVWRISGGRGVRSNFSGLQRFARA